jgi:hypothetical protein
MLNKIVIDKNTDINIIPTKIKEYLKKNISFTGLVILDYFGNIHINDKNYIPQLFNNHMIYISSNSFQQNNIILSIEIRKYVANLIKNYDNLVCIGGESYMYALTNKHTKNIYHYTNNISIYNDCSYNSKYRKINISNNIVNYNNNFNLKDDSYCIINISKLVTNLINLVNNNNYKNIIIISCHHDNFWNKIKLLTNYKLVSRKKFICHKLKYFITINLFTKKPVFVSLGANCSVAYALKKYNLRNITYPFDWSNVSLKQLIDVLENDFTDFEKVDIHKLSLNHVNFETGHPTYIIKNKYNIKFAHESYTCANFSEKLLERVDRFRKLINPTFIRLEMNKINIDDLHKLIKLLDLHYDKYKLIVITKDNLDKITDKIVYYKLDVEYKDWKYEHFNWNKIFNTIL